MWSFLWIADCWVLSDSVVTIYMPMIPELAMTMLACARIGAVHSVVFAGFSSEALGSRIQAASSEVVVTADHGIRGGKRIPLKDIVNAAVEHVKDKNLVKNVLVWERKYEGPESEAPYEMDAKDVRMDILVDDQRPYCPPEPMEAEENLFILYTSGSTGLPKVGFEALLRRAHHYGTYAGFFFNNRDLSIQLVAMLCTQRTQRRQHSIW